MYNYRCYNAQIVDYKETAMDQCKKTNFPGNLHLLSEYNEKLKYIGITENATLPHEWAEEYQPCTLIDRLIRRQAQKLQFITTSMMRAMNRPPGPSDFWWKDHQRTCSGHFLKIKEPEKTKEKFQNSKTNITNWLKKPHVSGLVIQKTASDPNFSKGSLENRSKIKTLYSNYGFEVKKSTSDSGINKNSVINKQENGTNLTYNWNARSAQASESSMTSKLFSNKSLGEYPKCQTFALSGKLGGSGTGRSNLIDKFLPYKSDKDKGFMQSADFSNRDQQNQCLISNNFISGSITTHLSNCLTNSEQTEWDTVSIAPSSLADTMSSWKSEKPNLLDKEVEEVFHIVSKKLDKKLVNCPICNNSISGSINMHLDNCLTRPKQTEKNTHSTVSNSLINIKCSPTSSVNNTSRRKRQKRKIQEVDSTEQQTTLEKMFDAVPDKQGKKLNKTLNKRMDTELDKTKNKTLDMKFDKAPHKTLVKELANCPVCNGRFSFNQINDHLDKCLSSEICCNVNKTIILDTDSDSEPSTPIIDTAHDSSIVVLNSECHKCLVCNTLITDEYSLNEHLEECIGNVFNNDSVEVPGIEEETNEVVEDRKKYPCPVCMVVISEQLMNHHLDLCLKEDV
ncbi:hypothetical protein KM043_013868 [Ampulex compressa]|nr:hypothetical protein KM043_013868 [Ampulex compressa]